MNNLDDKLKDVDWKEFVIEDVFEVVESSPYSLDYNRLDKQIRDKKEVAYVTRSSQNNGVSNFIADMSTKNKRPINGNCITIGLDTATINYQTSSFYTGQNIHIVRDKRLNKYSALFIIPLLKKSLEKFGWGGYSATLGRFKSTRIMLPINNGLIDWAFMENFMKQVEEEVKPKLNFTPHEITDNRELSELEWGEFIVGELFEVKRGTRLTKNEQKKGNIPYISSTALNNGVDNFINPPSKMVVYSNCLTIANSGSVGATFYHPYNFVASDHVTTIKHPAINQYNSKFLIPIFNSLKRKYSFNREISDKRLKRETIILPLNDEGTPNWNFMEQYMKRIENNLLKRII